VFWNVVPLVGRSVQKFDFSDLVEGWLRLNVKALYGRGIGPRKQCESNTRAVDPAACAIGDRAR
jgi:hypothetical protein